MTPCGHVWSEETTSHFCVFDAAGGHHSEYHLCLCRARDAMPRPPRPEERIIYEDFPRLV